MAELCTGALIAGRFQLERQLGAGGLAEVWVALDQETGSRVALKILHEHLTADQGLVERFRQELAVTRHLRHENVVRVYDLYDEGGRPLFSMELLEGMTLSERMKQGPVPHDEARRIVREIALALQAAHQAGVVHRDLKPQNIVLTADGRVKLLDFGLARAAGWTRLTAQSTVMGTPGYIAPELLTGGGADARSDLYALGATWFELLTGRHAFPGMDVFSTLRAKGDAPPSPRALDAGVSEADDAAVRRALEPDPERRFLDAGQVLRALGGITVPAAPESAPALTAGDFEVVVTPGLFGRHAKTIVRVLRRLGCEPGRTGFRTRLGLAVRSPLMSGASRESADAVAALLHAEGVPATVRRARPRGRLRTWLNRRAHGVSAAAGATVALSPVGVLYYAVINSPGHWIHTKAQFLAEAASHPEKAEAMRRFAEQHAEVFSVLRQAIGPAVFSLATVPFSAFWGLFVWTLVRAALDPPPLTAGDLPASKGSSWRAGAWALGAGLLGALLGALGVASAGGFAPHAFDAHVLRSIDPAAFLGVPAIFALLAFMLKAPAGAHRKLEPGDPAVRRIADGIDRRLQALRVRIAAAPAATRMVLAELGDAAAAAGGAAAKLAGAAALVADPLAKGSPDAHTLPPGSGAARDRAVDRLLEVASALDDALQAAGQGVGGGELLARLRHEAAEAGALQDLGVLHAAATPVTPSPARIPAR